MLAGGGWDGGCIKQHEDKWEVKRRCFRGMYGCLGGPIGAPMVTDDRYLRFGHRRGRLRQENDEYEDFRLRGQVFTHKNSG